MNKHEQTMDAHTMFFCSRATGEMSQNCNVLAASVEISDQSIFFPESGTCASQAAEVERTSPATSPAVKRYGQRAPH